MDAVAVAADIASRLGPPARHSLDAGSLRDGVCSHGCLLRPPGPWADSQRLRLATRPRGASNTPARFGLVGGVLII